MTNTPLDIIEAAREKKRQDQQRSVKTAIMLADKPLLNFVGLTLGVSLGTGLLFAGLGGAAGYVIGQKQGAKTGAKITGAVASLWMLGGAVFARRRAQEIKARWMRRRAKNATVQSRMQQTLRTHATV